MIRLRRSVIAVATIFCVFAIFSLWSSSPKAVSKPIPAKKHWPPSKGSSPAKSATTNYVEPSAAELSDRLRDIEIAFQHAWDGYSKYCFGHDSLHPVTNKCDDDFGGLGATAIDALSSAILMENEEAVLQILEFIARVDFTILANHNTKIQSFEVIIRHFGGMISAYDLLNGPFDTLAEKPPLRKRLLEQIVTLGDILACSFNTGPLQIPRGWVDPVKCITDDATTNTIAGVGTMVLEFARLSAITGNPKYVKLAEAAEQYLIDAQLGDDSPFPGLLGSQINIKDGQMANQVGGWGAPSDSYYEYLIKAYIYDQKRYASYLEPWQLAVDSTIRYIGSSPWGYANWTLLPTWTDKALQRSMDSLSWFAGGNFILGGMVTKNQTIIDYGLSIADTAGAIYSMTATGLGPEFVSWKTECDPTSDDELDCNDPRTSITFTDTHFKLRPEVLETWYYAYRATHDPKYRAWAWAAFEAIRKYCQTASGFSAIGNVDAANGGTKLDMQESFVFAEVLKYIYLIHSRDNLPYHVHDSRSGKLKNTWVFNTEAHPLKVVGTPI